MLSAATAQARKIKIFRNRRWFDEMLTAISRKDEKYIGSPLSFSRAVIVVTANLERGQSAPPGAKVPRPHPDSVLDCRVFAQNAAKVSSLIVANGGAVMR